MTVVYPLNCVCALQLNLHTLVVKSVEDMAGYYLKKNLELLNVSFVRELVKINFYVIPT